MRAGGAEEVAKDDRDVVSAFRAVLADRVGKERFDLWFGANVRLERAGDGLVVGAPSGFFSDFLRINFRRHLEAAWETVTGSAAGIEFRVDRTLPDPHAPLAPAQPPQTDGAPTSDGADEPASDAARRRNGQGTAGRRRFAALESFVVGPSNRLAYAAAELAVRQPGELSPLLVYGPTGVGKTHLLEGVWTAAKRWRRDITAIYLSSEQFASGFLQALRGQGLPSFRRKYRDVDVLILDDLQFLCGKKYTQVELLYTIDTLLREGRQLVLASDCAPRDMGDFAAELATRLESGVVCPMEPPDYPTRLGIVRYMAHRMRLDVPEAVVDFIASHLTRHARQLSGALCRLKATSQATGEPITLRMAEEALGDLIRASSPVLGLADIDRAVCHTFGLEPQALKSSGKAKRVTYPRMLAMWLARKYTRSALSEIGQYFGGRSHATVISANKRVEGWLADGTTVELASKTWQIAEAIREVERSLRAG